MPIMVSQGGYWKWFQDDDAEPSTQLAAENAEPIILNTNIIRLRLLLNVIGGTLTNYTFYLQYSINQVDFYDLGSATHWNYANGQATEGNATTGYKLTGATAHGEYYESASNIATFDSHNHELDFAIQPTANAIAGNKYYFRLYNSGALVSNPPGACPVVQMNPSGETQQRVPSHDSEDYGCEWDRSTGALNYANVDEYPSVNDADYNYTTEQNYFDEYQLINQARGTITMAGIAEPYESFTIDSVIFYWVETRSGYGEVTIGTSKEEASANIKAAMDADHGTCYAIDNWDGTVTISSSLFGTAGNSVPFTESSTNMSMNGGGFLGGTVAGWQNIFSIPTGSIVDNVKMYVRGKASASVAAAQRVPTSDSVAQWTRSTGSYNYALVDEYPSTNDADYTYSLTYNAADSFGFTAFDVPAGATITNVKLYIRSKKNINGRTLNFGLKIHGDHWWVGVGIVDASYTEYSATWVTNPHSGVAWTVDDVNGVGINGIQEIAYLLGYAANGDVLYVSRVYVEVNYTAAYRIGAFVRILPQSSYWDIQGDFVGNSFAEQVFTWTVNPDSELPWTPDDINFLSIHKLYAFGYKTYNEGAGTRYVARAYIEVNYHLGGKPYSFII